MNKSLFLSCLIGISLLSSCALFKRNRVADHRGIERKEFNLPIFLYPSQKPQAKKLLIFLSGDGGWIKFEDDLAAKFSEQGFYTIGINSRDYFWKQKTPEQAEADIAQLIRKYAFKYNAHQVYLCGYSFGADVLPFIYARLPFRVKRHVQALEMLSPFSTTDFMVHFADLTNLSGDHYPHKVDLEVAKLSVPIFCFYGMQEDEKPLQHIDKPNFHFKALMGDHHYEVTEYDKIVSALANHK